MKKVQIVEKDQKKKFLEIFEKYSICTKFS